MNLIDKLDTLIAYLSEEQPYLSDLFKDYPNETIHDKYEIYRGYVNLRTAMKASEEFLQLQDEVLKALIVQDGITSIDDLTPIQPQLYEWQGDITTLEVDAIVNAANSDLLGCTQANHNCIDNTIHTRSGVQLRFACQQIMDEQGRREPIGRAKITRAYNLPSQYVIHTVGPFIAPGQALTPMKEELLKSSYLNCLKIADAYHLQSIAFCCISTGEFNFPNEPAARIAYQTVKDYLKESQSAIKVIFNTYLDIDHNLYQTILTES